MDDRQETVDLVTFTEEILNGKLHFFGQWKINTTKGNVLSCQFTS